MTGRVEARCWVLVDKLVGAWVSNVRYSLVRQLEIAPIRRALFVMLNPSTADETLPDPTITRCAGFARAWGYPWLDVANLFAWRSTDPRELPKVDDPIGHENDAAILALAKEASLIVCAWGSHAFLKRRLTERAADVTKLLRRHRLPPLHVLGLNKDGMPKHPLYLRGDLQPQPWEPLSSIADTPATSPPADTDDSGRA